MVTHSYADTAGTDRHMNPEHINTIFIMNEER